MADAALYPVLFRQYLQDGSGFTKDFLGLKQNSNILGAFGDEEFNSFTASLRLEPSNTGTSAIVNSESSQPMTTDNGLSNITLDDGLITGNLPKSSNTHQVDDVFWIWLVSLTPFH